MPLQSKVLNSKYKKRSNLDVRTDRPDRTDVDDNRDCNPQKNARVTDRLYSATYEIRVRERKDFGVSALEGINRTLSELQRIRVRATSRGLPVSRALLLFPGATFPDSKFRRCSSRRSAAFVASKLREERQTHRHGPRSRRPPRSYLLCTKCAVQLRMTTWFNRMCSPSFSPSLLLILSSPAAAALLPACAPACQEEK